MSLNAALIVDDVELNRDILAGILETEYTILEAENGRQAVELIEKHSASLSVVLLDLIMPDMDGFSVLEIMKQRGWLNSIPVLIISGEDSVDVERKCFELGVFDFVHKPFDPLLVKRRTQNAADLYRYQHNLEDTVAKQTDELVRKNEKLTKMNEDIVELLGEVVEARDPDSGQHVRRVKDITRILAEQMAVDHPEFQLTENIVSVMVATSALHDLGKITIPDSVLLKPGKLTTDEFELMKTHTTSGCSLLEYMDGKWDPEYYALSYEICRHHHEKWDGRGYPDGLKGDEIPLCAQIVSVADCFDALTSDRVYKKAFSPEKAYDMIKNGECGQFSPYMQECFDRAKEKLIALVHAKYPNRACIETDA